MNSQVSKFLYILLFFLVLQIVWFNHIRLFVYFSPIIFIYPFLILPLKKSEVFNLIIAFFSGLLLDIISNTGGVFTATAVFVTYLRKVYFIMSKNPVQKLDEININNMEYIQKIIYFSVFILLSHIMIYFLDAFNVGLVISKWQDILINTGISLFFIIFSDLLFFNTTKQ